METKDLLREVMEAERLAERGRMVLQLNERLVAMTTENTELRASLLAMQAELEAVRAEIPAVKP